MSAEPVALIPQCEQCRRVWLPAETAAWHSCLDEDDGRLVFFCADCAKRESGDDDAGS